jgi:hypothetical protein
MNRSFDVQEFVRSRPLGITLLGGFLLLAGIYALCSGTLGATASLVTCFVLGSFSSSLSAIFNGILKVIAGSALMSGQSWVRTFTIVVSAINLVQLVVGGVGGAEVWNIALSIIVIIYMFQPNVQRFFNK